MLLAFGKRGLVKWEARLEPYWVVSSKKGLLGPRIVTDRVPTKPFAGTEKPPGHS